MSDPKIRLFVNAALQPGVAVALERAQAHYLTSVMRVRAGASVLVFNGRDGEWRAEVHGDGRTAGLRVCEQTAPQEMPPDLWLCCAPIRKGRIDWIAEKACELGVARLVPTLTRRSVVDKLNLERLTAHMVEAAEQCGRTAVPAIAEPVKLETLLAHWPSGRRLIFCDETGGAPLLASLEPLDRQPAAILIGPEGGFDQAERDAIRARPEAIGVSLGPRILRADTAAVAAISLWQATQGDWH
jgi:16S rRNA (uracil1498-N3)-methyltransferase